MERVYLEDYKVAEKFVSPARTITETDIVLFAAITGDWHPIHTDVEYAKKTPFGQRIAHGMLVASIGGSLPHRLGPNVYAPKGFIAFYGINELHFTGPLKIGDTIRCELEVIELQPKDEKKGLLVYKTSILNHQDELLVTFIQRLLVARKPAA